MDRKFIIPPLVFMAALVGVAGLYQFDVFDQSSNSTKTYAENGVSFNYPHQWGMHKQTENGEMVSVGADGGKILLTVYKFNSTINSTMTIMAKAKSNLDSDPFATNKTETNRTVNGLNATGMTYLSMDDGSPYEESFLTFEKNGFSYVIQYFAYPPELYDQNKGRFEMLIDSFRVE